jgi:predicted phage-related endonuclease
MDDHHDEIPPAPNELDRRLAREALDSVEADERIWRITRTAAFFGNATTQEIEALLESRRADRLDTRDDEHLWEWWVAAVLAHHYDIPVGIAVAYYREHRPISREAVQIRRYLAAGRVPKLWIERLPERPEEWLEATSDEWLEATEEDQGAGVEDADETSVEDADETSADGMPWAPYLHRAAAGLSPEDLDLRRTLLSSTDYAVIAGHSPWRSPVELWRAKRGEMPDQPMSAAAQMGLLLEPTVIYLYTQERMAAGDTWESMEYAPGTMVADGVGASPDLLLYEEEGLRDVQIKTSQHYWDRVPDHIIDQVHIEHYVITRSGGPCLDVVHVPTLVRGRDYRTWEVVIDLDYQRQLVELGREWWQRHMVEGEPPVHDPGSDVQVRLRYPRPERGDLRTAGPRDLAIRDRMVRVHQKLQTLKAADERLRAMMMDAIGENEGVQFDDGHVMTWRPRKDGTRVFRPNLSRLEE